MDKFELNNFQQQWENFLSSAITMAPRIITAVVSALVIYLVGSWIIKLIKSLAKKGFEKQSMEISLQHFLLNLLKWVLNIILFIVVVTQLGVQTSAFVAIVGAAGLAIGLALQGSLSNFAGGILILLLKPFKVGDFIASDAGPTGTVLEIDIFNTKLTTPQNQLVVVPNGVMSNSSITNYSHLGTRRTWFDIGVSYNADLKEVKKIILNVINENEFVMNEPAPQVVVTSLGDSAINLSVRATTSNEHFWAMNEELIIESKIALDRAGIEIPFPQQDIHIYQKK